ncbi:Pleckstrin-domain containing protein [Metarhizium album ARSEF 1941]|uniref:Pleckstrin-domain containing protein n=1 Tax=Metarhizium album (strain ARSEF 1941) TaxID=1081103 RepID=A0A0B2WZY5_METAS|nr:Pleckstrin-domain containing protein [Metarhizium album ARSEF 1941]KHN99613.1 Pleckstrin-domain containing protein [Metarhizium album ARSEF 1941]
MDRTGASIREDGQATVSSTPPPRRRYSMEEDLHYNRVMAAPRRRLSQPEACEPYPNDSDVGEENPGPGRRKGSRAVFDQSNETEGEGTESLPNYQSSLYIEGVFSKKHEIENTTKRAEDRHWHTRFVTLNGTALNVYTVKKDWGWGRSRDGPSICPDNPPWVRKSKLEKSYSLIHADAGIAADYTKRRYVIRIRAETDQFLLSCIELATFVKWLEALFAAIDVAAPIDDRDFPRDMSIPRIQRIRWFQGQSPALPGYATSVEQSRNNETSEEGPELSNTTTRAGASTGSSSASALRPAPVPQPPQEASSNAPPRMEPLSRRLSTSSYPNPSVDPHTGKWFPEHRWSNAHDLLYAKLCYSNLLFRSPRKSNYIISKESSGQEFVKIRRVSSLLDHLDRKVSTPRHECQH